MKATKLAFEDRYGDDSGVEFAVRLDSLNAGDEIEFDHITEVSFPLDRLPWLIACLQRIQEETTATAEVCLGGAPHWWGINADTGQTECRLCHKALATNPKEGL